MGRVDGKVAFVTGAARGQGRSHAIRLAHDGADIVAVDAATAIDGVVYPAATSDDLDQTISEVRALGRRALPFVADVRDLDGLTAAADDAVAELGRLDIVVANAGIATLGRLAEMDDRTWQTMIDVNLTGAWKTIRATVPHMISAGRGGAIVLTSSCATTVPTENIGHYTAAKSGLTGLMRVLAKELAPHRIRVNTVNPGNVATTMVHNEAMYALFCPSTDDPTREDFEAACQGLTALPVPMVDPVDISNAVLYLVSDDGRYVTGQTHLLDAGEDLM